MLAIKYEEFYTIEDYKHWEGNWELIEGTAYAMSPSPSITHQSTAGKIFAILNASLQNCPKCQALFEIDWEVCSDTVVRPDLLVVCYELDEKVTKRPEMIFEIVSPSSVKRDEQLKYALYQQEGVGYYCIVYPEKNVAKLYKLHEGRYIKVNDFSDEMYRFELDQCTFAFDFSKIWRKRVV